MTLFQAMLLGLLQGATEFLPVSSSGHLFLAQRLLGLREPELAFDLLLHVGTLVAVVFFLRSEIASILSGLFRRDPWGSPSAWGRRDVGLAILASLPTAAIGFAFHHTVETALTYWGIGARYLVLTALLLLSTNFRLRHKEDPDHIDAWEAVAIGVIQGAAVFPGLSRSGSTIALALLLGIAPLRAAKFSFLISLPAILGGTLVTLRGGVSRLPHVVPSVAGFAVALAVGYIALLMVERLVVRGRFHRFAPYTLALSALCFFQHFRG